MITPCRCLLFLLVCGWLQACETQVDQQTGQGPELDRARALIGPWWPAGPAERTTTAGDVYLGNLASQIRVLEQQYKRAPNDIVLVRLARSLYYYFQITAQLPYAERARSLLAGAWEKSQQRETGLVYAEVLAGFHEFQAALDVLDAIEPGTGGASPIDALRASVEKSLGRVSGYDSAVAQADIESINPTLLVNRAADALERGQPDTATRLLRQAQENYTGTSPYLLAWIHVQQGIVFLRWNDYPSAQTFFAAAHERFPQYVLAAEHLAETELGLGHHERAVELYSVLAKTTAHPEFYFRLSIGERVIGRLSDAATHAMQADEGYASLLRRYPGMYSDHAARYYMDKGDAATALALAVDNIGRRQDISARRLLVETQLEAGNTGDACREFQVIRGLGFSPPELTDLAGACGDLD